MNKTEISNNALNMVGQQVIITNLTDNNVSARVCNLNIDAAIREVLAKGKWRAARKRQSLVQGPAPDFGFAYSYILPQDYLHTVALNDVRSNDDYPAISVIEDKFLLTDQSTANLLFVADLTHILNNVNVFDALLSNLFVINLAIKISWPLQQSAELRSNLMQQFAYDLREAKRLDSAEDRPKLINGLNDSKWLPARVTSTQR